MNRLNCGLPIFGLTEDPAALSRMTLFREVFPLLIQDLDDDREHLRHKVEERLLEAGVVAKGDLIVLSHGDRRGRAGGTNTISIVRVGEPAPVKRA
jgi:pyruvate kinase